MTRSTWLVAAFATLAYAQGGPLTVTIGLINKLDKSGSACTSPPAYSCTYAGNTCCYDGNTYFAALFDGLPTDPSSGVGVGAVYTATGCGTNCNTESGSNACIGCKSGGSSFVVKSANWYLAGKGSKRDTTDNTTVPAECGLPDLAHIDGHDFDINYDVPQNVTDVLVELAWYGNATYDQIPDEVLEYETDRYRKLMEINRRSEEYR